MAKFRGRFLKNNENNLIENGNFFAGLEATQTGDLDRSFGHNRFTMLENPGAGRFVLEQNGAGNNNYDNKGSLYPIKQINISTTVPGEPIVVDNQS